MKINNFLSLILITILCFACKTEDVEPVINNNNNGGTTILGCMDATAVNYNAQANSDDGCCYFNSILLNEILYDPNNVGLEGDANGDGVYVHDEDEFIELVNVSNENIDISGYEFYDNENLATGMPNHVVPPGTVIFPQKAYVVFGGGNPTGNFGNAIVHTSSASEFNLNNSGDTLTIKNDIGQDILYFYINSNISANPDESYNRSSDVNFCDDFVQHSTVSNVLFSPGTKLDGTSF